MTLRFFLLPYLERFHERYPGVRFHITNGPTPAAMKLLKEGRIDFAVVSGPLLTQDPYLERFHERYPGVRFHITNGPTPAAMKLLKEGRIDFAVVSGPLLTQDNICTVPVRGIRDIFVAGPKFAEYARKEQPLSVLEKLPLITLDKDTSTRAYVQRFLEERNVHIQPEFELSTSDMIVQFALRNLGVGCVVKDFAKKELDSGELVELQLKEQLPERQFLVASGAKGGQSLAAAELLKLMTGNREKELRNTGKGEKE